MSKSITQTPAIGIDLGTTYCCMAVVENDHVNVIHNTQGKNTTPSYISFTDTDIIVGDLAKELQCSNMKNTIYDVKRFIGRQFNDEIIQSNIKHWPFDIIEENSSLKIRISHQKKKKSIHPVELSARMLMYLKDTAEDYLDGTVTDAVVTVPAYFNNSQREATKFAAKLAGLNILRILNEPTAAAIAYGYKKNENKNILVYDLGGGTFDVSIIEILNGTYTVKAVGGNNHLGGEDFNNSLVDHYVKEFQKLYKIDLRKDRKAIARLHNKCEQLKIILSTAKETKFAIDLIYKTTNLVSTMTREQFEQINEHLFQMTIDIVNKCLVDAKLDKSQIDDVVLAGGSSRIPRIKTLMQKFLGDKRISKTLNPDESVAIGAALLANQLQGQSTMTKKIILQDVTPLSLGIGIHLDQTMYVMIKRNSKIPITESALFKTIGENQTRMKLNVYEGEDALTKNNDLLRKFHLDNVTEAPLGETMCKVSFLVDINGILTVSAEEINSETNVERKITITHRAVFTDDDIERIIENLMNI